MTGLSVEIQIDETMSPDDHMLTANLDGYFKTSRSGLDCVLAGVAAAGLASEDIGSVLDFGSGYGRVYRALVAGFPNARLTACDLMEPAARFCAETFGGDWVKSHEDLDRVELPRTYDLVWLGSVFTHLPAHRWWTMLRFLGRATSPGGLVVLTTHGQRAIQQIERILLQRNPHAIDGPRFELMKESIEQMGFDFIPNKPAAIRHQQDRGIDVSQGEYGFSFATEAWVSQVIAADPDFELVRYAAPGWGNNHDAATLRRI